ncbi:hypothetical protein H5410_053346 [Solanum commersonii]|uniref:Uncharacterized protein n=1 Tax=Solanum commersonii TaxID=4109 RepID=A0A9J5X4N1_SOLCO|nr:hypothetical protein H5410_053346 [Solanum commersonii]
MDHRLWMYNMHYETSGGLKSEFIDDVRGFIEHTMTLHICKNGKKKMKGELTIQLHLQGHLANLRRTMTSVNVEKEMRSTPLVPEVFKRTHVKKKENESDPDAWMEEKGRVYDRGSRNDVRRLQSGLEDIGSSCQVEALDVINLGRRPATSSFADDIDGESEEDNDFIDCTT